MVCTRVYVAGNKVELVDKNQSNPVLRGIGVRHPPRIYFRWIQSGGGRAFADGKTGLLAPPCKHDSAGQPGIPTPCGYTLSYCPHSSTNDWSRCNVSSGSQSFPAMVSISIPRKTKHVVRPFWGAAIGTPNRLHFRCSVVSSADTGETEGAPTR